MRFYFTTGTIGKIALVLTLVVLPLTLSATALLMRLDEPEVVASWSWRRADDHPKLTYARRGPRTGPLERARRRCSPERSGARLESSVLQSPYRPSLVRGRRMLTWTAGPESEIQAYPARPTAPINSTTNRSRASQSAIAAGT